MLVGLQGSGKTTSLAKLALWLKNERKRHPLLVSTDVDVPPRWSSCACSARQIGVPVVESHENRGPDRDRARRALARAEIGGYDVDR